MTYQDFLTAFRGAGATLQNANDAARMMGLKRRRNWTQATWISKVAEEAIRRETADRQRAEREEAEAARKAKLAAEAERRGSVESFIKRAKDMSDADRKMSYMLILFSVDVSSWNSRVETFKEDLDRDPTYALSWAGDMFQAAASYEVACKIYEWFEAGVDWSDMTSEALKNALLAARNAGSSHSTSVCSSLLNNCRGRAWAKAYENLSGYNSW